MFTYLRHIIFFLLLITGSSLHYFGVSQTSGSDLNNEFIGMQLTGNVRSVKIPVEIHHNLIIVPLSINGSFQMNFILDTGVKTTILTEPEIAPFLNLQHTRSIKVRGLGKEKAMKATVASKVKIEMPQVSGKNMQIIVLPPGAVSFSEIMGKRIHGIIGYDLFKSFVVELNYSEKYIRLYDPKKYKYRKRKKMDLLPIHLKKSKPYIEVNITDDKGKQIKKEVLLDTGASQAISLFYEEVAIPEKNIECYLGKGLSGDIFGKLGKIKQLRLGKFVFEDVVASYPEKASIGAGNFADEWNGNLGGEILQRFQIIIDYPNHKIGLKKGLKYRLPFTYNISGVEMVAKGLDYDEFYVVHIRKNSSAYQAGLQAGDQIVMINGINAEGLNLSEAYKLIDRKAGTKICLKVQRTAAGDEPGKKYEKVCFRLREDI